jgi:hypothetical protein
VLVESGIPRDEPGVTSGLAAQVVFRTYGSPIRNRLTSIRMFGIHRNAWRQQIREASAGRLNRMGCRHVEPVRGESVASRPSDLGMTTRQAGWFTRGPP